MAESPKQIAYPGTIEVMSCIVGDLRPLSTPFSLH